MVRAIPFLLGVLLCAFRSLEATSLFSLPDTVVPLREQIEITVDPAQDHFTGVARIDVRIDKPQSKILLNGRDLKILDARMEFEKDSMPLRVNGLDNEFLELNASRAVAGGNATLVLRYEAPLPLEGSTGPYRAKVAADWYVFTTFTPIDARRAFPCFDEPRFKTPWELSFRIRNGDKAFTNTPQSSEVDLGGGWKLLRFARSRPLPAEVVAFAVGPFGVWEGSPAGAKATPIRVITARGASAQGEEAALETVSVLPRLEGYTGIPYPWEKLDHVALPRSAFGAVENPGLITYKGSALLTKPGEADAERRRSIRRLEAHELAHQWFGNLVTQANWAEVWLSEGFATWFSARTMDEDQPADRKHLASIQARERIMLQDDGPEARPVRRVLRSRSEMKTVYNPTVYQKGGAILMMLESWIGPERMQRGLREYLGAHAFGNATTEDLENSLKTVALEDPTDVMNGYLNTTGVPEISFEVNCNGGPKLLLKRESGKTKVPVCYRTDTVAGCLVVADAAQEVPLAACPRFVYPNAGGTGYYRTRWTGAQVRKLSGHVNQLVGAERLTLVYDLARASSVAGKDLLSRLGKDIQPEIASAAHNLPGIQQ